MSESTPSKFPSLGANLLLLAASTLLATLFLAGLELALRGLGWGDVEPGNASRLKYQKLYLPILDRAERADGTWVWRSADIRLPYQSLLVEKPAGGLRILTVGGSAAAGLGYSPNTTFTRTLERMLSEAQPQRSIEAINLGIVALASQQVKLVATEACRRYDPDVVIVYSGNNEFLELHAERFAALDQGVFGRSLDRLRNTNLRRLADRLLRGPARVPALDEQDFSSEQLRVTEARIIRDIEITPKDLATVIDRYEANLEEMASAVKESGARLILMTVASNWKWRGRSDLPDTWLADALGDDARPGRIAWQRAMDVLASQLASARGKERWELLFRRAVAAEQLGDLGSARADYRAAMNADPHVRRALDAMNDRVRGVAKRHGAALVDTVRVLAERAEDGIPGFDAFYDYVHFTPQGAMWVAAALYQKLRQLGSVPSDIHFDVERYTTARRRHLAGAVRDSPSVEDWQGFSFDKALLWDRDLWKYEGMRRDLDQRLEADPRDLEALVYRGNAYSFDLRGAAAAARDYRSALTLAPERDDIRANLERLIAAGRL